MSEDGKPFRSRRAVLLAAASASIGALVAVKATEAQQKPPPHVDESDAQAREVGYTQDATKLDPKASPMFKAGSCCSNCLLLRGKAGEPWRPCNMFSGRLVNANGWCRGWTRNPYA
jgi:hypothetical protein